MKKFLLGLVLTIVGITSLMLIPSTQEPAPMPWEVTLMPDNNVEVFGIHLGTTTYLQAQEIFHEYGKVAIFTQENKPASVEAYFNSINQGGLSAKIVLTLNVAEQQINSMLKHALEARIQPSGARRYDLSSSDELINTQVLGITYIPSVKLNTEMILHRFGEAAFIKQDINNPNTKIWHYPALALTIYINPNEKTLLQYQVFSATP